MNGTGQPEVLPARVSGVQHQSFDPRATLPATAQRNRDDDLLLRVAGNTLVSPVREFVSRPSDSAVRTDIQVTNYRTLLDACRSAADSRWPDEPYTDEVGFGFPACQHRYSSGVTKFYSSKP